MARPIEQTSIAPQGSLKLDRADHCVDVYFIPSASILRHMAPDVPSKAKIMCIDTQNQSVTIYPTRTIPWAEKFLRPKHSKVRSITLEDKHFQHDLRFEHLDDIYAVLEDMPAGFTSNIQYGLGLRREYWPIIDSIEDLSNCSKVVISKSPTRVDGEAFVISWEDFESIRKELNRVTTHARNAARSINEAGSYNVFAERLGCETRPVNTGRHPVRKAITAEIIQGEMFSLETQPVEIANRLAERKPQIRIRLQNEIERTTLEQMIDRFREMMDAKRSRETDWQKLFCETPFILSLAFGHPVVKVKDQAYVGGRNFSGKGDKIADFIFRNGLTSNVAITEIKTPDLDLLNKGAYRDNIYAPSRKLSGAISQVLDQRYHFQKEIVHMKDNDGGQIDIRSYFVHCCLVAGRMPADDERKKSFELFRHNSKDVEIVTFDELLKKLEDFYDFVNHEEHQA